MRLRLLILGALALLAVGCGSTSTATEPATTATATIPVSPKPMAVTVFKVDSGVLRLIVEHVPHTTAVAAAALGALGLAADVSISDGTATVALGHATQDQAAEIVYTLTQFATVKRVDVGGRAGLTRDDFASYVPPILVESPAAGAEVRVVIGAMGEKGSLDPENGSTRARRAARRGGRCRRGRASDSRASSCSAIPTASSIPRPRCGRRSSASSAGSPPRPSCAPIRRQCSSATAT